MTTNKPSFPPVDSDQMIADAEIIASFLDGKLTEMERQTVLQRLDHDEAFRETFVETAHFHQESASPGATQPVVPILNPHNRWIPFASAAAALAILATTTVMLMRVATFNSAKIGQLLMAEELALPPEWHQQGWSQNRGVSAVHHSNDVLFRVGVRTIDLDVALRTGAVDDALLLTKRLDHLLQNIEFSAVIRYTYAELAQHLESGDLSEVAFELADNAEHLITEQLAESSHLFAFGQCAEAGRLAALTGNEKLFRSRFFRRQLSISDRHQWNEVVETQLETIQTALAEGDDSLDFGQLLLAFETIINEG